MAIVIVIVNVVATVIVVGFKPRDCGRRCIGVCKRLYSVDLRSNRSLNGLDHRQRHHQVIRTWSAVVIESLTCGACPPTRESWDCGVARGSRAHAEMVVLTVGHHLR